MAKTFKQIREAAPPFVRDPASVNFWNKSVLLNPKNFSIPTQDNDLFKAANITAHAGQRALDKKDGTEVEDQADGYHRPIMFGDYLNYMLNMAAEGIEWSDSDQRLFQEAILFETYETIDSMMELEMDIGVEESDKLVKFMSDIHKKRGDEFEANMRHNIAKWKKTPKGHKDYDTHQGNLDRLRKGGLIENISEDEWQKEFGYKSLIKGMKNRGYKDHDAEAIAHSIAKHKNKMKKKVKEETEQVDEISDKTKSSYLGKLGKVEKQSRAAGGLYWDNFHGRKQAGPAKDKHEKHMKTAKDMFSKGKFDSLKKEETEIDETSVGKAQAYLNKVKPNIYNNLVAKKTRKDNNHIDGYVRASKIAPQPSKHHDELFDDELESERKARLKKEDTDVNELSMKTLHSFVSKAKDKSQVHLKKSIDLAKDKMRAASGLETMSKIRVPAEEETTVEEGRRAMPIRGHSYHMKSDDELRYIMKDAHAAAQAMRGHSPHSEAKYLDQINDAATVLGYRKRGGKQVMPKGDE